MTIDLPIIYNIVQRSLEESQQAGCSDELCERRAIFHALKALYLLCKDQKRNVHLEITGAERGSSIHEFLEILNQPECSGIIGTFCEMVQECIRKEK